MTQPAKVQEPSMEEILASIRRIIADDEAKPTAGDAADRVEPGAARPSPMAAASKPDPVKAEITKMDTSTKPQIVAAKPSAAAPMRPAPVAAKAAPAAVSNSQDDIDAMLAGLDTATSDDDIRPSLPHGDVFELTDDMALPDPVPKPFQKVDPQDDLEFSESVARPRGSAFDAPPPDTAAASNPMLSRATVSAVESAFNSLANTVLSNNARTLEDLVKEMLRPMLKNWLDDNLPGLVERIVKAEIERVSRGR